MLARAGIFSRAIRRRSEGTQLHPIYGTRRKSKGAGPTRRFHCYMPCMAVPCAAAAVSLVVFIIGLVMVILGYFGGASAVLGPSLDDFGGSIVEDSGSAGSEETELDDGFEEEESRRTSPTPVSSPLVVSVMVILTYLGPLVMGIGCFVGVIACVVVCETRDKILEQAYSDVILVGGGQTGSGSGEGPVGGLLLPPGIKLPKVKADFYELVVKDFHKQKWRRPVLTDANGQSIVSDDVALIFAPAAVMHPATAAVAAASLAVAVTVGDRDSKLAAAEGTTLSADNDANVEMLQHQQAPPSYFSCRPYAAAVDEGNDLQQGQGQGWRVHGNIEVDYSGSSTTTPVMNMNRASVYDDVGRRDDLHLATGDGGDVIALSSRRSSATDIRGSTTVASRRNVPDIVLTTAL